MSQCLDYTRHDRVLVVLVLTMAWCVVNQSDLVIQVVHENWSTVNQSVLVVHALTMAWCVVNQSVLVIQDLLENWSTV